MSSRNSTCRLLILSCGVLGLATVFLVQPESRVTASRIRTDTSADTARSTDGGESNATGRQYTTKSIVGRVVYLAEVLNRKYGVSTVPEAKKRILALQTADGELLPIVEDLRGRAFRKDERLHEMDLELVVRRYKKSPAIQIVRVFKLKGDSKFELDYWCDVCAIEMFELGPCACCQAPNRMRLREVSSSNQ